MRCLFIGLLFLAPLVAQETGAIPAEELARAPTPARVASLVDRATAQGWGTVMPGLRAGPQPAYESNSGYPSQWYYLYRWARLLGTPYQKAIQDWIKAVDITRFIGQ